MVPVEPLPLELVAGDVDEDEASVLGAGVAVPEAEEPVLDVVDEFVIAPSVFGVSVLLQAARPVAAATAAAATIQLIERSILTPGFVVGVGGASPGSRAPVVGSRPNTLSAFRPS